MFISGHNVSPGRLAASIATLALIVGACSTGATASPAAPAATPAASASAAAAGGATLTVAESPNLGKYLAGADGKTLYIFTNDTAADKSTCVDACATAWPPLMATGGTAPAAPAGATGKLATFARPDGSMQVSYNGKPLYYYAKDTKAGDTSGQGVGGKWFIAAP
jgi:predicted lipoprotein with Yx(FWY)xxD motif